MDTNTAHLTEKQLSRKEVFSGRLISVYSDEAELADGTKTKREVVIHRGAVCIVPVDDLGNVILVRQWRYPLERTYWEVPAGTRDAGESTDVTAHRELKEETGYTADVWEYLGEAPVSPGYSNEMIYYFKASSLHAGEQDTDDDERLDVAAFSAPDILDLMREHDIDTKTIAALALAGLLPRNE